MIPSVFWMQTAPIHGPDGIDQDFPADRMPPVQDDELNDRKSAPAVQLAHRLLVEAELEVAEHAYREFASSAVTGCQCWSGSVDLEQRGGGTIGPVIGALNGACISNTLCCVTSGVQG